VFDRSKRGEHALLIQPHSGRLEEDVLEEFTDLARSAGASIAATLTARIDRPNPSILIGTGKLDEVKAAADATGADLILVNHSLSPVQERNLERFLERRVIDRTGLILDIFAQRAHSHEGKLQVELAQLRHMATRLVRGWTHLERQRGGAIGLRAGKSTLFNALTGAEAYAADKLFATLDPTVRRIIVPGGSVVLADTVGFVRDLPHELVAAFRSTLSEAREADFLLHIVDAADPHREERIAQVDEVLAEVGAGDLPQLLVFNKIDRIDGAEVRHDAQDGIPDEARRERVWISARDGLGLPLLQSVLGKRLGLQHVTGELRLPPSAGRLRSRLHQLEVVRSEQADEDGWLLDVDLPIAEAEKLAAGEGGEPIRALLPEKLPEW